MARVLVVEDHEVNLELMRYLLTAHGHEVVAATDAEQALQFAHARAPDLVLCDIELPGIGGVEFARRVRADPALAHLPLLAVTSNAMPGDRERLIAEGFDSYTPKPIDPQTFVPWMEGFLRQPGRRPVQAATPVILVVDDVASNLALKRSCLEPMGWRVITASSAAEALAMTRFNRPALIISDVGMPLDDGFDFLRAVKRQPELADVPFIFITSTHWDETVARQALALGAARYLRRPLSPQLLIQEVSACIGAPPRR